MQSLMVPGGLIILAGSFVVAWFTGARRTYLLILSAAYIMLACAFCTMLLRDYVSKDVVLPAANFMFIATQILLGEALLQRRGKTFGILLNLSSFIALCTLYYGFYLFGTITSRTMAINVGLFAFMTLTVFRFWIRRDDSIHDKLIFWTLVALGVMHSVRTFGVLVTPDIADPKSIFWQFMQVYILLFAMVLALEVLASHFVESLDSLNSQRDRDHLTGVLNRAGFERAMHRFFAAPDSPMTALILLDLDDFKVINDTRGHPAGDAVLRQFGRILSSQSRSMDIVGRFGGDEFAIIAPGLDARAAVAMAERIRRQFSASTVAGIDADLRLSCSIGVGDLETKAGFDSLYRLADQALYEAKRIGRDRVVSATAPTTGEDPAFVFGL
ncbi:GGDEF domain-containing protein [Martelella sp. HB161492]|uniref:GGDEF domain-containing protein n=1 Tax=Martelella sp. HB161492 TaxID=2720726 RepID=UPI00158F9F99|nr:GGDEF domain-containing protein [Martelella sp. HB161492]